MNTTVLISDAYQDNKDLRTFIDALPSSFNDGGVLLWNGRNKIKSFLIGGMDAVVAKRFKNPNVIQKVAYLFRKHKAMKSYLNAGKLIARQVDTPLPVACVELRSCGLLFDAYYICERNDMPPIEDLTDRDDWDKNLATAFARFAAGLHKKGILHHDLNDTNVRYSIEASGEYLFSVIDINRMAFYDNIDDIPMKERIENLTRFTGRLDLYEYVMREYARTLGLEEESFASVAVAQKKHHDRNWYRRKRLLHPFGKRKYGNDIAVDPM